MKRLNWEVIASNIAEAREQLQALERTILSVKKRSEVDLQIGLEHAYHHLNFAWNARRITSPRYRRLSDPDFRYFSRIPGDLWIVYRDMMRPTGRRPRPVPDIRLDFSDMPESTDEELKRARRLRLRR